jgi:hypothetical protein
MLLLDGVDEFAASCASTDATPVRRGLPGRVGLDPETMEQFWRALAADSPPAPPTGVIVIRGGEVLVLAPERAALGRFRVSRKLPADAIDALRRLAGDDA